MVRNLVVSSVLMFGLVAIGVAGDKAPGTWIPLDKTTLSFPASEYSKGALLASLKDIPGLIRIFKPETPNDPSLTFKGVSFDPATSVLTLSGKKKIGFGMAPSATFRGKLTATPYVGCTAGETGYEIKYHSQEPLLQYVFIRLCGKEKPDGSLSLYAEVALTAGRDYKNWAEGTFRDVFGSLQKALNQHIRAKSMAMKSKASVETPVFYGNNAEPAQRTSLAAD